MAVQTRRVAPALSEIRQHRLEDTLVEGRSGGVVQIRQAGHRRSNLSTWHTDRAKPRSLTVSGRWCDGSATPSRTGLLWEDGIGPYSSSPWCVSELRPDYRLMRGRPDREVTPPALPGPAPQSGRRSPFCVLTGPCR